MLLKTIKTAVALFAAVAVFSSCAEKAATVGSVNYLVGATTLDITEADSEAWSNVQNTYLNALESIPEVTRIGNFFMMEGKFKDCDAKIVAACASAESTLADVRLEGYAVLRVRGIYDGGEDFDVTESVVYQKSFGTEK